MITSKKGKEMFLEISPIYFQSRTMMAIYQAIGYEADLTDDLIRDLQKQMFVQTATWGLDFWEVAVGLPVRNGTMTIESRRRTILAKMQTRYPITPTRVKEIIETATGVRTEIIQNVAPYTFEIRFPEGSNLEINFTKILDEIKPAHLSYRIKAYTSTKEVVKSSHETGSYRLPVTGRLITSQELFIEDDYTRYRIIRNKATVGTKEKAQGVKIPLTNTFRTGTWPNPIKTIRVHKQIAKAQAEDKQGKVKYPVTGIFRTGGKVE